MSSCTAIPRGTFPSRGAVVVLVRLLTYVLTALGYRLVPLGRPWQTQPPTPERAAVLPDDEDSGGMRPVTADDPSAAPARAAGLPGSKPLSPLSFPLPKNKKAGGIARFVYVKTCLPTRWDDQGLRR